MHIMSTVSCHSAFNVHAFDSQYSTFSLWLILCAQLPKHHFHIEIDEPPPLPQSVTNPGYACIIAL